MKQHCIPNTFTLQCIFQNCGNPTQRDGASAVRIYIGPNSKVGCVCGPALRIPRAYTSRRLCAPSTCRRFIDKSCIYLSIKIDWYLFWLKYSVTLFLFVFHSF